jgi:hypothetical protein
MGTKTAQRLKSRLQEQNLPPQVKSRYESAKADMVLVAAISIASSKVRCSQEGKIWMYLRS